VSYGCAGEAYDVQTPDTKPAGYFPLISSDFLKRSSFENYRTFKR
jgi:hypothetical protein